MAVTSAGLIMFRRRPEGVQVLLGHPGGPFWRHKDLGSWTIPKGRIEEGEDALQAARREFQEEVGFVAQEPFIALNSIRQKSGKIVHAWAFEGDCDPSKATSITCEMQWPPHSGRWVTVPELDRVAFFDLPTARQKLLEAQRPLLDQLEKALAEKMAG